MTHWIRCAGGGKILDDNVDGHFINLDQAGHIVFLRNRKTRSVLIWFGNHAHKIEEKAEPTTYNEVMHYLDSKA